MRVTRVLSIVGGIMLTIFLFSACAERLAEFGLEQALESGSEGNLDIDLDLNGDGGFSVSGSEDGEAFSFNLDAEDGTIAFGGTDGSSGVVEFGDDGIVFDTSEGSGTIGFDEENGQIDFDTDQGSGQINFDEGGISVVDENGDESFSLDQSGDGSTTVTTADSVIESSPDPLAGWPEFVGFPSSRGEGSSFSRLSDANGDFWTGFFVHDVSDPYLEELRSRLSSAGFIRESVTESGDNGLERWTRDAATVSIQWGPGTTTVFAERI